MGFGVNRFALAGYSTRTPWEGNTVPLTWLGRGIEGRVPDRAGPDALLDGRGHDVQRLDAEPIGVARAPATDRVFQHAEVVEGRHRHVELRIGPGGGELRVALALGDLAGFDVHRAPPS